MTRGSLVTARRGSHIAHQLTVSIEGKTHTVYVPPGMVEEVRAWIANRSTKTTHNKSQTREGD
jgi:hypothetical protein